MKSDLSIIIAHYNPLNILEIKLQTRFTQLDLTNATQPEPEYLIQFHTWF